MADTTASVMDEIREIIKDLDNAWRENQKQVDKTSRGALEEA